MINIGLGVFNLIPLPPLDGSKVIKPILPYNAKVWFENNEKISKEKINTLNKKN